MDNKHLNNWEDTIRRHVSSVSRWAVAFLCDGDVFCDIGANTGVFSEQVLAHVNATAYLFEPVPGYYNYCKDKFAVRSNVIIENLALSEKRETISLWCDDVNLGWNTIVEEKKESNMNEIKVNCVSFSDYARSNKLNTIDFMKIDVEGAEFKVFNGMRNFLSSLEKKPIIMCEVGWGNEANPNWQRNVEMFEWFFSNGYERFCYDGINSTTDVLFFPVGKKTLINKLPYNMFVEFITLWDWDNKQELIDAYFNKNMHIDLFSSLYSFSSLCIENKRIVVAKYFLNGLLNILEDKDKTNKAKLYYKLSQIASNANEKYELLSKVVVLYPEHQLAALELSRLKN